MNFFRWSALLFFSAIAAAQTGVVGDPVLKTSDLIVYETGCGAGLGATGSGGCNFDATELDALTWDAGTLANFSWTFSLSGATDPVIQFADGAINATTGTFQVGGTPVVLESRSLTGGNGIATLGDLSANRTITVDVLGTADGTGVSSNNSGLEFGGAGSDTLALLQGCGDGEVLKWTEGSSVWGCAPDGGGSNPLALTSCEALTIATGAITLTGSANTYTCHSIDTESAAASDDLTTLNCTAGSKHMIFAADSTRTVVVKDGSGVLVQADFSMDNVEDVMTVYCSASNTVKEVSRSNNGA